MSKKRISLIVLSLTLILSLSAVYAVTNIVPDNNFAGDVIELSLEEATEKLLTDSTGAKTAEINLQSAEATVKDYSNQISQIRDSLQIQGFISSSLPSSSDEKVAIIVRDFAETQGQDNYDAEINALKLQIRERYFSVLQAGEMVDIQEENVQIQKQILDHTQQQYDLGLVKKNDLLKAELSVTTAEKDLASYENNYKLARMDLNAFLGYDVMQDLVLTETLLPLEVSEVPLAEAIESALANSNSIKGAEFNYDLQEFQLNALQYRYPTTSPTYLKQEVAFLEAEAQVESVKDLAEIDVRKKYMDMMQGLSNIEVGMESVKNAKEQLDTAMVAYKVGHSTLVSVQQAQLQYMNQQMALSQAILEYNLAIDHYNTVMTVGTTTAPIN